MQESMVAQRRIGQSSWQNTHQKYLSGLGFPVALQHRATLCPALRAFVSGFFTMYGVSGIEIEKRCFGFFFETASPETCSLMFFDMC